ncbi:hypothetical protein [Bifidobacterium sp. ESL0764]|uniref:hypothetical protein n=1 Tax=Bifidobacterium sp. ESL0764 TaxID=2983228 RepID=UPI0023F888D1|nr:hypothetical protein [Bifidobacterium sp. ESL0764]WEV65704.1 hypothetical protein OZX71_08160 [Bifidobacterium sp. ESL0764]
MSNTDSFGIWRRTVLYLFCIGGACLFCIGRNRANTAVSAGKRTLVIRNVRFASIESSGNLGRAGKRTVANGYVRFAGIGGSGNLGGAGKRALVIGSVRFASTKIVRTLIKPTKTLKLLKYRSSTTMMWSVSEIILKPTTLVNTKVSQPRLAW